jgi:hypothetical protein
MKSFAARASASLGYAYCVPVRSIVLPPTRMCRTPSRRSMPMYALLLPESQLPFGVLKFARMACISRLSPAKSEGIAAARALAGSRVTVTVGPLDVEVGVGVGVAVAAGVTRGVGVGVGVGPAASAAKMLTSVTLFHVLTLLPWPT